MCGIAGIYHLGADRPVEPDLLVAMTDLLHHRGPDDSGVYVAGPIGLGQRRLSIVDLSAAGRNPMPNEDESLWITFNGEIYDALARREGLAARGHRLRSRTDTEVVLHLYEEQGVDSFAQHRGMFAFALWDAPRRTLFVVRDPIGIKPLYWREQGGTLAFASELKALLVDPECPREVDRAALGAYLRLGYVPSPHSILAGVHKLSPGHYLEASPTGVRVVRYWAPPVGETTALDDAAARTELRARLEESVRMHLMSDVPFGAFLSGGIDSSLVCALMARVMDEPVRTFSIGFAGAPEDETAHARAVARHIGAEHHEFVVEPDALRILPELVWYLDEPLSDPSILPTWAVSEMARGHVTVALSGDGGDETFGGYETYRGAEVYARAATLPQGLLRGMAHLARAAGGLDGLVRKLDRAAQPALERHIEYMSHATPAAVAARVRGAAVEDPAQALLAGARAEAERFGPTDLRALLHFDLVTYMTDDVLAKVDRMAMAHSLEVRVPLLDHTLVEFAARLPWSMKRRGGVSKWILREVAKDLLPAPILARGKQGFGVPLTRWFGGDFDRFAASRLSAAALARRPELDAPAVGALVERATGPRRDPDALRLLWSTLLYVLWAETFVDAPPRAPAAPPRLVAQERDESLVRA